ncbi:MAG: PaaI family thioesterase [Sulfurimonas sp.]|nr:PaaI family thioesterase [Sulfurimonas sp.]
MITQEIDKEEMDFLKYIGGEVLELGDGYAKLGFDIKQHHKQLFGVVHGGAIATLADHCGWYAAVSVLKKEQTAVTIELKINYLKPADGEVLRAEARVVQKSKRTVFTTIELFSQDTLIAYSTATYHILTKKE